MTAQAQAAGPMAPLPSGWDAARTWQQLDRVLPAGLYRQQVQDRAIRAVLARARELVRHAARPTRSEEKSWPEEGDLDLERSLEAAEGLPRPWPAEGLRLTRNAPREADVVAVLDMSLSMTGEKVALLAVAAAILAIKLGNLSVVAFDTGARTLVAVGERVAPRELVRRILSVPTQGYTHIEAGLARGLEQLRRSRRRERVGLVLTDGVANVGASPVRLAGRFPRLHVVHLGDHSFQGARCCREMAIAGRGRIYRATTYGDLPAVVRKAVRDLFRA